MTEDADPPNIVRFHETIALFLARLYRNHPVRLAMNAHDFLGPEISDEDAHFLDESVHWLIREGFVHCDDFTHGAPYFGACLTSRGYTLLQSREDDGASKGSKLLDFAKDIGRDVAKDQAKGFAKEHAGSLGDFLGGLLGSFMRSAS